MAKQLAIELSDKAVRFSVEGSNDKQAVSYQFTDKKDYLYKEQLEKFLQDSGFRDQQFDEYTVSWSAFRSTLIPSNVFGESKPENLYRLCFGNQTPAAHIDYNRIPEQGLVNVYEIPLWVKSFFVLKFPRSVIQHEGSHLIRGIFNKATYQFKATLVVYPDYFLLMMVKENKLLFYSMFEYLETDDIVYHLMFTLQQKELLEEKGTIELCPGVGTSVNRLDELTEKLNKIGDLKQQAIRINQELITQSQTLCV